MANNNWNNRLEYKRQPIGRVAFYNAGVSMQLSDLKRITKMAQIKLLWLICDIIGIPVTLLGIVANLDNIKSAILAILGIAYLMIRAYYYVIKSNQSVREKELDLWHLEQDKKDRMNKTSIK